MIMKKFLLLLVMLISFGLASEIIASNNQIVTKSTGCTSIDGKGVASFVVTSPEAQVCDLSFLMMPGEYEDGSFTSVNLKVNGVTLPSPISFSTYGWQPANTTGNAVTLNEGDNTVQFISGRDDVPIVDCIKVGKDNNISLLYKNYEQNLENEYELNDEKSFTQNLIRSINPINYGYSLDQRYSYTTYIPLSYSDSTKVTLYAPSANDPMFGFYESLVEYKAYIFNEDCSYSKSVSTTNKSFYWQDSIPPGNYYILFEAKDDFGYATLRINSTMYKYCYSSKVEKDVELLSDSKYSIGGYYNIFTTNAISNNTTIAHPKLWFKKKTFDEGEIIVNYDGICSVISNYDWKNNARIRCFIPGGETKYLPQYSVLLSSGNPQSTLNDEICNIYYSKLRGVDENDDILNGFPNLLFQDAIMTESKNEYYNCISWSAQVLDRYLWPDSIVGSNDIHWFDMLYNNEPVPNWDGRLFQRNQNLPRYTRNGATEENSVIDLWGIEDLAGNIKYTHASITNNAKDGIPHGYDWESKIGKEARIFHPRYALTGSEYGRVVAHYRLVDEEVNYKTKTMQQQVAEEDIIIETITLTESELAVIDNVISNIPLIQETNFNTLYDSWKQIVEQNKYKANLWEYKKCSQYSVLLTCMQGIDDGEYLAYKKFAEDDFMSILLIQDFAYSTDKTKDVWNIAFDNSNMGNVMRSQKSSANLFIKNIIEEKTDIYNNGAGRNFSNTDYFHVTSSSNTIKINIEIEEVSTYKIEVIDLSNNYIQTVVPETIVQAGAYEHSINVLRGNYVVAYYLNGNIHAKKVLIK